MKKGDLIRHNTTNKYYIITEIIKKHLRKKRIICITPIINTVNAMWSGEICGNIFSEYEVTIMKENYVNTYLNGII